MSKELPKSSGQLDLFSEEALFVARLAPAFREPLELLLTRNQYNVIDRRIYWWVLSKLGHLQTAQKDVMFEIPSIDLSFKIPVRELYCAGELAEAKPTIDGVEGLASDSASQEVAPRRRSARGHFTIQPTYQHFKQVADGLVMKSIIKIDHMNLLDPASRVGGSISMFTDALYQNGFLHVTLNRKLVPTMCRLSEGYTEVERQAAFALSSEYSQLLYVQFCRWVDLGKWVVSLTELQRVLGAETYSRYSNFKQRVLVPAVQEINLRTGLAVDVEEVRTGKKVTSLRFAIGSQKMASKLQMRQAVEQIIDEVQNYAISDKLSSVIDVMASKYTFSREQERAIIASETLMNEFIRLGSLIDGGVLTIKTSPTRYIASILFPGSKPRKK